MKYLAFRLPDLQELHGDLELDDVSLTRGINAPGEINANLRAAEAYRGVTVEGTDEQVGLIREFGTLIVALRGRKARGFILHYAEETAEDQEVLALQGFGVGTIPDEMPWEGPDREHIQVDPMAVVREIWGHVTDNPDVLTVTVDRTRSPVRIGEEEREIEFTTSSGEDVSFEAGPYRLNWYSTTDLGKEFQDLATETPFEWREVTTLDRDSEAPPSFHIELGYPILEPVERDLYFEVGANVIAPDQSSDQDFYTEVLVLGAGEGNKKRRGSAKREGGDRRMRRVKVVEDRSLTSNRRCDQRAKEVLAATRPDKFWTNVSVTPRPSTPPEAYDVGDIITVKGLTVWGRHSQKCRIVELTHHLETDVVDLQLEPWGT